MNDVFAIQGEYEQRCAQLMDAKIALWDVLAESVRPGSLDSDIRTSTSQANDFKTFFDEHRQIECVLFNGQKAAQLFGKFVEPCWPETVLSFDVLPSTSPAYASMSLSEKTSVWRQAIV